MNIIPSTVLISFTKLFCPYKESLMWSLIFQIQADIFHIQITIDTSGNIFQETTINQKSFIDELWRANRETLGFSFEYFNCFLFSDD